MNTRMNRVLIICLVVMILVFAGQSVFLVHLVRDSEKKDERLVEMIATMEMARVLSGSPTNELERKDLGYPELEDVLLEERNTTIDFMIDYAPRNKFFESYMWSFDHEDNSKSLSPKAKEYMETLTSP
ncbi:hypothetical protein SAMN02745181_0440 [Rubritalea squalenifaciens DSM 18772]|uniref:Uncharacterized protein n=1 Tax=Rubritalea squalenifaciens DSM 18772 TaxID=1123071 RepID=A0A1M6CBP0_9BACT|nr:hypothetical protein [Rubritalea squalenifaciens]SHI58429.1 hypothetical protein SAMN02745181_0440 [Rubritalea squalenifaciens DSM 18772]